MRDVWLTDNKTGFIIKTDLTMGRSHAWVKRRFVEKWIMIQISIFFCKRSNTHRILQPSKKISVGREA